MTLIVSYKSASRIGPVRSSRKTILVRRPRHQISVSVRNAVRASADEDTRPLKSAVSARLSTPSSKALSRLFSVSHAQITDLDKGTIYHHDARRALASFIAITFT